MNAIEFQYNRIRRKNPDATELEIWHGVAVDFYLRTGDVPEDVLIQSALAQAESYGFKYRPDQPRVPAGNPDGGQWTDEGGDGGSDGGGASLRDRVARNKPPKDIQPSASDTPAQPASAADSTPRFLDENIDNEPKPFDGAEVVPAAGEGGNYGINLLDDEGKLGSHTLSKHVHENDQSLLNEAKREQSKQLKDYISGTKSNGEIKVGSFTSVESANKLVNATLADNKGLVALFQASSDDRLWIRSRFSSPTGREAYAKNLWNSFDIRDTYGVFVLLVKDPTSPRGFRVHTSFPIR